MCIRDRYKSVKKGTKEVRAIKWINKDAVDTESESQLFQEIDILRHLDHPNIMKIFEFGSDSQKYIIVSELITGGELLDTILKLGHFGEKEASYIMRQVLAAITYCHSKNIVHRDLKPENILIDTIVDGKMNIKIIDFGTALLCPKNKKIKEMVGSAYYIAPEVLTGKYTSKCDVWSIGVILYMLLSGFPPFNAENDEAVMEVVKTGVYDFSDPAWDSISEDAKDLIKKMLTFDQNKRISAAEAYQHKWIQNQNDVKVSSSVLKNLHKFHATSKLHHASMMYIVTHMMSKEEQQELEKTFKSIDENGDGRLSREELIKGYTKLYESEQRAILEVDQLLKQVDADSSGSIDYSEFLVAAANSKNLCSKANVKQAFDLFDSDGSGYITSDEVKKLLGVGKVISEEKWVAIIKEMDPNGDGKITFEEFEEAIKKTI
eukprot:TRINITY_DN2333_c0_g1_i7.p1 TRINITY_DN2333_c0_g1~~TRINITY_DN2333_c0_g1_i7.p1  ORF type:complete len:457 (-),score=119.21 TRINITY_DN2333_c0_g1_i7:50-1348(-)